MVSPAIDGIAAYDNGVKALVFGADSDVVTSGRVSTVQAIGGTGSLEIASDFLKKISPNAKVLISNPSWENHKAIFTNAGFEVGTYAYYDAATRSVDFAGMLADLNAAAPGTIVVLHACCHNPTGYDITAAQWDQVIEVVKAKGLVAFLDMAYQGFGHGIAEDGAVIGKFVAAGLNIFVSTSFSKSFSLYGERVGALSVVANDKEEAARVLSQLKIVIRTNYSDPPTHGGAVVAAVLNNPELRALWERNWARCACASEEMRRSWWTASKAAGVTKDMSFITTQIGMFSVLRPVQRPDGAPAHRVRRVRHRHRPHVRGRAEQQEHRLRVQGHRCSDVNRTSFALMHPTAFGRFSWLIMKNIAASACKSMLSITNILEPIH